MLNKTMSIAEALKQSNAWIKKCNELVDSLEVRSDERTRVAAALFHLSLEHHGSINLLVKSAHVGSAFALLRPQFEAYVRGLWLQRCATEKELKSFVEGKDPPRIDRLLAAVEITPGFEDGVLRALKRSAWRVLCGFTHGGYVQVTWRITGEEITVDFGEGQLVELLGLSGALSLQAYIAMTVIANNSELANSIMQAHQEIYGYEEWHITQQSVI